MRRQHAANTSSPMSAAPASSPTGQLSDAAMFLQSMQDPEVIERVRTTITNAHVFKLPPRQSASVGWRGADWKEKVWQGTVKVVERAGLTAVLLVDRTKGSIFAVCPVKEGAVDRCVDSSRYFVLRIENANGRHMFIGVAFNERNDAFDFNTALEDSRREKEMEEKPIKAFSGPPKDYSIKEGEKIRVSIGKTAAGGHKKHGHAKGHHQTSTFLKPNTKDTPSRKEPLAEPKRPPTKATSPAASNNLGSFFTDAAADDPFPATSFGGSNFFQTPADDQSTGSGHPFFSHSGSDKEKTFDPRNYKTESGR